MADILSRKEKIMRYSIKRTIYPLAALLLFAACTQDELGEQGTALPYGEYPLQISSITLTADVNQQPWSADAPQTRVSENPDRDGSVWNNGDKIKVQIGDGTSGTYTYQDGDLIVTGDDVPAYWASKADNQSIRAWYTSSGSETVELGNQTQGLAYVLTAEETANFGETVSLRFSHALAKVRVVLQGSDKDKVDDVKIKSFTTCTHTKGTNIQGSNKDWITMQYVADKDCWEANVVPGEKITLFQVNGVKNTLDNGGITPQEEKVNTITLMVGKDGISDGTIITEPGNYLMKGNYSQTVTIQNGDNVILTLDGVISNAATAIKVESGHPTIIVKGENTFTQPSDVGTSVIALAGANAHITLDGQGSGKLTIKQTCQNVNNGSAVIGGAGNSSAGNIEIKDMSLHIDLTERYWLNGAVIGSGEAYDENATCGDITILNTDLIISGGNCQVWGAAIGTGIAYSNGTNQCGDIKITLISGQSKDQFLGKLDVTGSDGETFTEPEKVGKGRIENSTNGSASTGTIKWYNSDESPAN